MVALYIVGTEGAGKTAICAGLGKHFLAGGKSAGYLKTMADTIGAAGTDAAFMKQVLDLPESIESLRADISDVKKAKEAYTKVSPAKDVVIVEGSLGQSPDDKLSKASREIAEALNARVIMVADYSSQPAALTSYGKAFGGNLAGIILNKVPKSRLKQVRDELSASLGEAGIKLLGVLPEDRTLATFTVGELAECIQGKILNNTEKSGDLVENIMLGAMVVDSGLTYFGRKNNKAAVIRNDRPDMQLAALETSTRCLVLSGSAEPPAYGVLQKAENKGIPIIQAESDSSAIVTGIEEALGKTRFNQEKKLSRLAEVMPQYLDLPAILNESGLAA